MEPIGKANRVPRPSFPPSPRSTHTPPPATSAPPREAPRPSEGAFGIRGAMELLRRLPRGERSQLVEVIKLTLEALNVHVSAIVDDASSREAEIDQRIAVLRREATQHEEAASVRRQEITKLEAEQEEISRVKHELSGMHEHTRPLDVSRPPSNDQPAAARQNDITPIKSPTACGRTPAAPATPHVVVR
jgi:hypothetical protein